MIIRKAYKFRLEPTATQAARLTVLCGHARFVWNQGLRYCLGKLDSGEKIPSAFELNKLVTQWKKEEELTWLKEAYTDNLQQKLKDLHSAWMRCFDKSIAADKPRFKKKGKNQDSIRFVNFNKYCELDGKRVKLPSKLGWLKFRKSQEVQGNIKNCTVSFKSGHWYISFQVEQEIDEPKHNSTSAVGIDMGVAKFATLSHGSCLKPLNAFRKHEKRLAIEQRKLSRKVKFSANWKKQKARVQKLHTLIANCRKDYLHKASHQISKNQCASVASQTVTQGMSHPMVNGCKALYLPERETSKGKIACIEKIRERKLSSSICVEAKTDMAKPDWLNPRQDWDNADPMPTTTNGYVCTSEIYVVCIPEYHCAEIIRDKRNSRTGCLSRSRNGCAATGGSSKGSNPYDDGASIVADDLTVNTGHVMMPEGKGKQDKLRKEGELW
ncbi:transposase [Idiomarina sp.]|uniref:RNA-guided endonuclease InsQ/TnpB family protein n=1 Tax=Idiomarina sp. TaxID=1874361 RepID=UPI001D68FCA3|nr:transposase [Idiomarina sp.]MCJ8316191.1 transposase [Idiomarina sp.]NQZ16104.1 transposase [Idiomarina sp.]